MHNAVRIPFATLHEFCRRALTSAGACEQHAITVAEVLATADACGTSTHGSKLLPGYLRRLRSGGLARDGQPCLESQGPAWAIVNGNSVLGHVTSVFAMNTAIEKARVCGIGYVGVRNSSHFGAAGFYSAMAARQGMIGISMANDIPSVAAPGSRGAVTGTNPLSFAVPAEDHEPILLDMALSTVAGGKVYAAFQLGRPIPENWIIDAGGRPTTDSSLYPRNASLAPMGGHKGYGLALLVETLSGVLTGAAVMWGVKAWMHDDPSEPTHHGGAFIAIDVAQMMPAEEFRSRVIDMIDQVHKAPATEGTERVLVPGEMEWARRRDAEQNGVLLPPDVVGILRSVADECRLAADWLPPITTP